jgi:hypothetical protein
MSLDRKLDLVGILLLFVGLLTLLSLISASHNKATGSWLSFLGQAFGWGAYLFPVGLTIVGLWLVLRSFERVPHVGIERLIGVVFFFLNVLGWMHFFSFPEDAYILAADAGGGGYTGAFIFKVLLNSLGWAGTAITLFAWLIIALVLILDVSVVELFRWAPPLMVRIQDGFQDWMDERRNRGKPDAGKLSSKGKPLPPANWPDLEVQPGQGGILSRSATDPNQPCPWALPAIDQILEKGNENVYDDDVDRQRAG